MEIVRVSEVDYTKGLIKVELPAKDRLGNRAPRFT